MPLKWIRWNLTAGQKAFQQAKELIDQYHPYGEIDFRRQMGVACGAIESYSDVFIFSDFYVEFEDVLAIKNLLTKKKCHLHLMHFIDKHELSRKKLSTEMDWVIDSETEQKILFDWNRQLELYHDLASKTHRTI